MKPKTPSDPQTSPALERPPIKFSVNTIVADPTRGYGSRFLAAGGQAPYREINEVPLSLRPFVVSDEAETAPEPDEPWNACFELGVTYQVTGSGQLGRALSRQICQAEAENANRDWIEERLSEELREDVTAALEDQHSVHRSRSLAQAEYEGKERELAVEAPRNLSPSKTTRR